MQKFILLLLLVLTATSFAQLDPDAQIDPDPSLEDHYAQLGSQHTINEIGPHIHDPSQITRLNDVLMIAVTGKEQSDGYACGLELWYMFPETDFWQPGQCLFIDKPAWIAEETPNNDGAFWAPTFADPHTLYYTVSGMDEGERGCVGMATASGVPPMMTWGDSGDPIVCFSNEDAPGPITGLDPAYYQDADGTPYLVFGGGTIWAVELDPANGRIAGDATWTPDNPSYHLLAQQPAIDARNNPDHLEWIEAAYITQHDGFYYLFVNWGACCNGLNSTYEIRVGRSESATGPFIDRDGIDMRDGGGTLFLDRYGIALDDEQLFAPGHASIYAQGEDLILSFHYYDAENDGVPWIGTAHLDFVDGWPVVDGVVIIEN